jgi:glycosyltransferase involved in cell wall biosynthesis
MTETHADPGTVAIILEGEEIGGAELTFSSVAAGLAGRCEVVAILAAGGPPEIRERFQRAGARVELVTGLRRYCTVPGFFRLVARLRAIRPDLVHVSCPDQGGGLAGLVASRLIRAPAVATLHLVSPRRSRWRELVSKWALAGPAAVIAISQSIADYLEHLGIASTLIYNGVASPELRPDARSHLSVGDAELVVGGIGRIHEQKGWDVLCRAATLVRERAPEVEFVVVGDGPEREALAGRAECAPVRFVGYEPNASSLLGAFDMLAVPSRWEGFGRVAVEGMLSRVPVIAADVGGLSEVVGDAGLLVPPEQPEALAGAILELARGPARRRSLATSGRRRAVERFGTQRMLEEIQALYVRLLLP